MPFLLERERKASKVMLNLNMDSLMRNGFQWTLGAVLPYFAAQLKNVLWKLLSTAAFVVLLSLLLFSAVWLTVDKEDYSNISRGQEGTVATRQWWWSCGFLKILKDALFYAAALLPSSEPLTMGNLLRHRDQLSGANYVLRACFDVAIDVFNNEPQLVQQNARIVIQCAGPPVEFLSGNGDCGISVYLLYDKIQHNIRCLTPEMYLARLSVHKEPLSITDMLRVRRNLKSWGVLSPEMEGCLDFAVQEFAKEPSCVQDNARMVVDCSGQVVTFASGNEQNNINIYNVRDGNIHYRISTSGLWASTVRFFRGNKDHTFTHANNFLQIESTQKSSEKKPDLIDS